MFLAIALVVVAILFFRSPLAPAAADAIRHHNGIPIRHEPADDKLAEIIDEMAQLREQVGELAERMDFTERMLADVRRRDVLQNPRS